MSQVAAVSLAAFGALLAFLGLFLLSAVVSVAVQGKPPDLLSTLIALALIAGGAVALRSAWQRWQRTRTDAS